MGYRFYIGSSEGEAIEELVPTEEHTAVLKSAHELFDFIFSNREIDWDEYWYGNPASTKIKHKDVLTVFTNYMSAEHKAQVL